MSYVMSRCKLALLTSLLSLSLTSTANAGSCDLKLIKEYTSVIDFRPSSMLCGADMGFLIIKLKILFYINFVIQYSFPLLLY